VVLQNKVCDHNYTTLANEQGPGSHLAVQAVVVVVVVCVCVRVCWHRAPCPCHLDWTACAVRKTLRKCQSENNNNCSKSATGT
jgi:hypothetical protein